MIRLQCEGVVIELPNPALGNTSQSTDEVDVKRTMIGGVFSYVRRRVPHIFKYSFDISRPKYYELLSFYNSYCANPIQLLDWKGDFYYGFIKSETLDNTQKGLPLDPEHPECSWGNQVSLEFEVRKG